MYIMERESKKANKDIQTDNNNLKDSKCAPPNYQNTKTTGC